MHSSCVQEVPNGALVDTMMAPCNTTASDPTAPLRQIYAMHTQIEANATGGGQWTSFVADWTVPALPTTYEGQVDYYWPGFKASEPVMGFPVLQPVLQYGQHGPTWQLQSWYVHAPQAVTAPAIDVKAGDKLTSYMLYHPENKTWTVSGTNTRTGESTVLQVAQRTIGARTHSFNWAMLVCETIKRDGACDQLPASNRVTFTNVQVDGAPVAWVKKVGLSDCNEGVAVSDGNDEVTLTWTS